MKIQLKREVVDDGRTFPSGAKMTTADAPMGTLMALVQTDWAFIVRETTTAAKPAADASNKTTESEAPSPFAGLGVSKTAIAALKKVKIETLEQAKAYIDEKGSLEPIDGVSQVAAALIAEAVKAVK